MGTESPLVADAVTSGLRLTPEARRRQLLGVARTLVEASGIAALSLENVASEAGVSRALIYTYFDNRDGLLRALWDEAAAEWNVQPMPPNEDMLGAMTLRELFDLRIEQNTRWYLDRIEQSGLLLHRLLMDPIMESSIELERKRVEAANVEWLTRLVQAMGVDAERAHVFSTLVNSTTRAMWRLAARREQPRQVIEDVFFLSCGAALDAVLIECGLDAHN